MDRTLELTDDALAMRFTDNGKLLAVALLDHTVKVHFADTLRFFVSLYGHRLPVMSLDVSTDNALLITGSSDKNVKVWGLDFGDCHRSLFAHDDAVMAVAFQPRTHYFFSGGKDGLIKYWDADRGVEIMQLPGHVGPVWSLAVSRLADSGEPLLVSGGADRTWRVWRRTEALVFPDEERELRLEAQMDAADIARDERAGGVIDERETVAATRDTAATLKAAERLGDALRLADAELMAHAAERASKRARIDEGGVEAVRTAQAEELERVRADDAADEPRNPLMLNLTPSRYVLKQVRGISTAELDAALLALPLDQCIR